MKFVYLIIIAGLLVAGCRDSITQRRPDYSIHGVDVSHYQSRIDWHRIKSQDIHFAFIKATEGQTLTDTLFKTNWQGAENAGLYRGAYHFFRPTSPPLGQVLNFIRQVTLVPGDLPPVLDVETLDGVAPDSLIMLVRTWLTLVEAHYGVKPILYTNQRFYNRYLSGHFDHYILWIARYSRHFPKIDQERHWHFWQYGDRAQLEGIAGFVDLNVFSGDHSAFEELLIRDSLEIKIVKPLPPPMPVKSNT